MCSARTPSTGCVDPAAAPDSASTADRAGAPRPFRTATPAHAGFLTGISAQRLAGHVVPAGAAGAAAGDGNRLHIDVVLDLGSPWCYIGRRRLGVALARWRLVHPDAPAPRVSWHAHADARDDGPQALRSPGRWARDPMLSQLGQAHGIPFAFERIRARPGTLRAHALIELVGGFGDAPQDELIERLMHAHFCEGHDIGEAAVLRTLAQRCGLPAVLVEAALDDAGTTRLSDAAQARLGDATHAQPRRIDGTHAPWMLVGSRDATQPGIGLRGSCDSAAIVDALERCNGVARPAAMLPLLEGDLGEAAQLA